MLYLAIQKDNYRAKILCGNTDQFFSLLLDYKAKGYTCLMSVK